MQRLLELEFSLFLLMAVGLLVAKLGIVGKTGQKNLTDLVLYVILPCNILNSFLGGADASRLRECLSILIISLGIQLFCVLFGKLAFRRFSEQHRKCLCYATICSNAGFLGNPVAEGVFGATGLMYASVYLIPLRIMMWSEGIATFSGEKDFRATAKKVLTHPCIISCAIGIVMMLGSIPMPALLLTPIQTIAKCNTALSMLVIGMILADVDLKTMVNKEVLLFTFCRLVVIPLLIWLCTLPISMSETARGICVLLAAMPAGATTSMLANKYDCDPAFGTKLVVFSTLCSIPAILGWCLVLA